MPQRMNFWIVLTISAGLLMGCGETGADRGADAPVDGANPADAEHPADPGTDTAEDNGTEGVLEKEIPLVNAATLKALKRQAAAQDKVLVVDCWASWCAPCLAMFPHLHKAMKERGDGVILMSLSFDESEEGIKKAGEFLTKRDAWDNAYLAEPDSDAKDEIAKVLSDKWDGGAVPAVFVFKPDGTLAYEMLDARGEVQDWVAGIAEAVDDALNDAETSPGE